ncbi:MAG: ribulose-phosphate 3-epimerase [Lachnospiraceae bacterium]|nr:ribulose-phosphate 3-epimerase [Lachnospiraceae bacterium]
MYILAPSLLAADFGRIKEQLNILEEENISWLHLDIMDGMFVPNISFGQPLIKSIRKDTKLFFDIHMMVHDPIRYVSDFAACGADSITFHYEAARKPDKVIDMIKELGVKVGMAVKPATPVDVLKPFIDDLDMILVMSVEPGFGGQKFMPAAYDKLKTTKEMITASGRDIRLEVDGGVVVDNIKSIEQSGADVLVAGSSVFGGDIAGNIRLLTERLK